MVQDVVDSVAAGIAVMDKIYEHSYFTIVAAAGSDANAGLSGVRPGTRRTEQTVAEVVSGVRLLAITWLKDLLGASE